jgi:hypothetical protein
VRFNSRPFLISFVVTLAIVTAVLRAEQVRSTEPLAPEKYKNIQVLTDVPARQVPATMDFFSVATSFACVDCHQRVKPGEPPLYEADTPRKARARDMIRMVKQINASAFGVAVTCATCHQGHGRPASLEMMTAERIASIAAARIAAPPATPSPNGVPAAASALEPPAPSVDAVLTKYFDAIGGRSAIDALPASVETAVLANLGAPIKADVTMDRHAGKFLVAIQVQQATQVARIGFDGTSAWVTDGTTVVDASEATFQKIESYVSSILSTRVRNAYENLSAEKPQTLKIGAGAAPVAVNVLAGSQWPDVVERLYFDAATGLLVRRAIATHTALGGVLEAWVDYSDYQPFAGVRQPRVITQTTPNLITTMTVTDMKLSSATDDARFARPKIGGQ